MSECKLNHSLEDVIQKYETQVEFLPIEIKEGFAKFSSGDHQQELLNEVFHLLKKYDLSTDEEKQKRNNQLLEIIKA
ncbi:group-specific protein [Cytobacillus spongiae]|jgi:hypothetical protein|uniref:group-specific protein n=1 Tax=Cytobacillus spongiae TaxID=2901381 RepID=UPI001F389AE7|nr:group-specific protein [Cytobacillus spongiae]UII57781.1 group-specific protein [Cytobacillus spongiae]